MTIGQAVDRLFKRDAEAWSHAQPLVRMREGAYTHLVVPEALYFRLVALACAQNGYTASLGKVLSPGQLEDACAHLDAPCEDVATTLLLSRRLYVEEYRLAREETAADGALTPEGTDDNP